MPALKGADPPRRPAVSPLPAAPLGVWLALLGPWHSGRWLSPPPLALFSSFSSFSKTGSAPPAGNPAPPPSLPPDREQRDCPGRAVGLSVSVCGPAPIRTRPRPHRCRPDLARWPGQRMRPGEAAWLGRGVRALHPGCCTAATWGPRVQTQGRDALFMTEQERRRDVKGSGNRHLGTPLGKPPLPFRSSPLQRLPR